MSAILTLYYKQFFNFHHYFLNVILLLSVFPEMLSAALPVASGSGHVKRTKQSKLEALPQNLIEGDGEDTKNVDKVRRRLVLLCVCGGISSHVNFMVSPPFQIKVGLTRYVDRSALVSLEETVVHFTGRVESLVDLFYGKEAPYYSVKAKSKNHISVEEIESMTSM